MTFKNIAIIGIGLIGSSLALALKKSGFEGKITGIGRREENLIKAKELGIIDHYSTNHPEGVKDADLIVLSSSVREFENILRNVRDSIKSGAIVTDVGSVKAEIIKILEPLIPEGASFVGGHPIAGKECSGIEGASSDLFKNANCIITPTPDTNRQALEKIVDLWNSVGTKTIFMSPEQHDSVFAVVSHLPHVVAYTLVNVIIDHDRDIISHGGKGLKDMTRIALSSAELWRDICFYNRDEILESLKRFSSSILRMIKFFEQSDWEGLEKEFKRAKDARQLIESD